MTAETLIAVMCFTLAGGFVLRESYRREVERYRRRRRRARSRVFVRQALDRRPW